MHRRTHLASLGATGLLLMGLALGLGACTPQASQPGVTASLPPDATQGAGDPTRGAILGASAAFGRPAALAGRPDAAARAVAQLEYLAVEINNGPRWRGFNPTVGMQLQDARQEARSALGIAGNAPPQAVIDALFAASRALAAGNAGAAQAVLVPPVFSAGGPATLQRLAQLPPLPRAAVATSRAEAEMNRTDRDGSRPSGGIGGGVRF